MKETFGKIWRKIKHFSLEVFAFISSKIFVKNFAGILGMLLFLFLMTTTWLKCYTNHGEALHMANFEGMNLLDVKDYAKEQGFRVVVDSIDIPGQAPLAVISQDPKPEALVKEKRTVYLRVQKTQRDMVDIPRLDGSNESYDVYRKALQRARLLSTSVTRVNSRLSSNTVLDIIYNNDTITNRVRDGKYQSIPRGSKLTIVVSERGYGNTRVPDLVCKTYQEAKLILESNNLNLGTVERDQTVTDKYTSYVWLQDPGEGSSIRFGEQVKIRLTQNIPDDCEENELEAPRGETPKIDTTKVEEEDEEFQ